MIHYLIDTAIEMAQLIAALAAVAAVAAIAIGPRRVGRVLHAVIAVTRSHAPRWIVIVLNVALAIPGPVDEAIVLAIIGVMIWRMPVLRAAMVDAVRVAWHGGPAVAQSAPAAVNVTITRRVRFGTIGAKLAAAAIAAGLIVAPVAVIASPAIASADGAASVIVGHARHRAAAVRPGHPVGCVDEHGRMVVLWPCHYEVDSDGVVDIYAP